MESGNPDPYCVKYTRRRYHKYCRSESSLIDDEVKKGTLTEDSQEQGDVGSFMESGNPDPYCVKYTRRRYHKYCPSESSLIDHEVEKVTLTGESQEQGEAGSFMESGNPDPYCVKYT